MLWIFPIFGITVFYVCYTRLAHFCMRHFTTKVLKSNFILQLRHRTQSNNNYSRDRPKMVFIDSWSFGKGGLLWKRTSSRFLSCRQCNNQLTLCYLQSTLYYLCCECALALRIFTVGNTNVI